MTSDVEYLLLKEKGPYCDVYVRRRLNTNPGACRFYCIVIAFIAASLCTLLASLVYVFVLVPSWEGDVLSWDGRQYEESKVHVLTHTHCGPVEGLIEDGAFVFKGIPYAQPPTGSRRWQKPQRLSRESGTCWNVTRQAKTFGNSCPQPQSLVNFQAFVGNEDCLFLNVWTTSLDPLAKLPVMFWIHGGFMVAGSGNWEFYRPTSEVTKATQAVYVSLNYRLGPFGYLTLDVLSRDSPSRTSGNYGLMDMVMALTWVKDNIRNFGGDPGKVTVFGQSSGGTAIHALLASPLATGLFQRAWMSSGSALLNKTSVQASKDNLVFLNLTGCQTAACLRKLATMEVMKGTPWKTFPYWAQDDLFGMPKKGWFDGALPTVDGYVLKEVPMHAFKYGRGNDVPLLLTTTAQEVDLIPYDPNMHLWTWQHYEETVRMQLNPFSPAVAQTALDLYPSNPSLTPELQYTSLVSDLRETCPIDVLTNVTSAAFRHPVFRGVITACPSSPVHLLNISVARYAFHLWDLVTFFGNYPAYSFKPQSSDLAFQKVLRQQVMAFARNGRPEAPVWEPAPACTALISDHVFPVERYNKDNCEFWLKNGFFAYAWLN